MEGTRLGVPGTSPGGRAQQPGRCVGAQTQPAGTLCPAKDGHPREVPGPPGRAGRGPAALTSVLERRAVAAPALVERSKVLWNVRLEDVEDVQAFLGALGRRLLLDGVQDGLGLRGRSPSGADLGGGLSGR